MIYVLIIVLIAGLAGGYAGHLANVLPPSPPSPGTSPPPQPVVPSLTTDLVIGEVAAFCVPALLRLAKSDLAALILKDSPDKYDLLWLAGLCLVAAYASRTFLQSMSGMLLKMMQQKLSVIESKVDNIEQQMNLVNPAVTRNLSGPLAPKPTGS